MSKNKNTKKPWTESHQKRYSSLFNYITTTLKLNYNKGSYITDHKKEVYKLIETNPSWKDGTKESYFFMVSRYLFNLNNNDKYVKIFSEKGFQLMVKTQEATGNNELDEKEQEAYRPHEFFINIISTFQNKGIITKTEHLKELLLKLLVFQPPLRTSFYTTAFISKDKKDNDGIHNYIYLNRRGSITAHYIVNKDKASNYKLYNMNKNLSVIELTPEATQAIAESLLNYPRNYLFEIENKPISQGTLLRWLRDITGVENINIDMMRASYITWFHNNFSKFKDREKLSQIMRHSQRTASQNYRKILTEDQTTKLEDCTQLKKDSILKDQTIRELQNKISGYLTSQPDKQLYSKRARDVIYNLNTKGRTPRDETLKKYSIIFDTQTNKYIKK